MPVGPSLPPHLYKRNRDDDDDGSSSTDSTDKRRRVLGPAPPPARTSPPRAAGPTPPPQSRSRSSSEDSDVGPAPPQPSKPARILGPALPPAPLDQRPPNPPSDDSDSSDDDDFGPAPPPAGVYHTSYDDEDAQQHPKSAFDTDSSYAEEAKPTARDAWMTMPPTQDDLGRLDPTKIRARKFNTGKSAGAPSGGGMGVWTETPEQKLKRLQDEAMGITAPANTSSSKSDAKRNREEEEQTRKLRAKIDGTRGKSLVEQHKDKEEGKDKEDDPSKRVFDYEKDMALGSKVSHKQRREMLSKAKGFGDRFSSGSYL